MTVYIARRLVAVLPVLFGVSVLVFLLLRLVPGDPALAIAGPLATQAELDTVRKGLGLDKPIFVQYAFWLGKVLQGDLGRSLLTGSPVLPLLLEKFGNSLLLASASMLVAVAIALPAGILAAIFRGSLFDSAVTTLALLGNCMAPFWTGLMLIFLFAVTLAWLPTSGMQSVVGGGDVIDVLRHLILPALTMGLAQVALVTRVMRSNMLDTLQLDHLRTARAKGLTERVVILRHAVKLALLPVVTVIGVRFGYAIGSAVIVETVFNWPGVGYQLFQSISARDYAFVQGATLLVAIVFVLINLSVDIAYVLVDPRIRYQ